MVSSRHFCAVSALALLAAGAANAQDAGRSAAGPANTVDEVVVTGTFIAGTSEDAAIPVEALTLEELRQTGSPSNLDLVKSLSEVGSVAGEANRSNLFAVGAQSINLRSVSASRTVVVFNGRRIPEQFSSSVGRFNNVAIIPNAAIGRIETLKDGGGVTYGADAVGGVVNYITRRNLDGVETNANYRYIDDSDGDWDADISFGKVGERWNAMLVVGYQHRSELDTTDRDFALQPYLMNPSGWTTYGQPGSYLFQRAGQLAAITPSATAASGNRFAGDVQMGPTGILRDPFCADLGGFAGFSATPSPVCYFQSGQITNLVEQQDTWQAYAEANYEVNRYFRVHLEGLYYQLDVPHIPLDTFVAVPLVFPLTSTGSSQTIGGSAAYAVAGSNPAVRHLLLSTRNSNGTLAFGDPDTPGTQAYQIVNGGRVGLPSATWRPFGVGGAPIPELEQQHNTSVVMRGDSPVLRRPAGNLGHGAEVVGGRHLQPHRLRSRLQRYPRHTDAGGAERAGRPQLLRDHAGSQRLPLLQPLRLRDRRQRLYRTGQSRLRRQRQLRRLCAGAGPAEQRGAGPLALRADVDAPDRRILHLRRASERGDADPSLGAGRRRLRRRWPVPLLP
ncbi:TonB-dependent receptor plug domain-containing protein [Phenylobacterium sp. J426]|nr:TonB-dependent receptor plug domain-containing protein [Phenylobacterium sp. J426]MCR5876222.1 TonB-dependent receptor plug domain-containing protein [Phenylobacterium sp. J426]